MIIIITIIEKKIQTPVAAEKLRKTGSSEGQDRPTESGAWRKKNVETHTNCERRKTMGIN